MNIWWSPWNSESPWVTWLFSGHWKHGYFISVDITQLENDFFDTLYYTRFDNLNVGHFFKFGIIDSYCQHLSLIMLMFLLLNRTLVLHFQITNFEFYRQGSGEQSFLRVSAIARAVSVQDLALGNGMIATYPRPFTQSHWPEAENSVRLCCKTLPFLRSRLTQFVLLGVVSSSQAINNDDSTPEPKHSRRAFQHCHCQCKLNFIVWDKLLSPAEWSVKVGCCVSSCT